MRPSSLLLRSLPPRSFALGTAHSPLQVERQLRDRRVVLLLRAVPAPIHGDTPGIVELPVPAASAAPASEERPAVRVLPDGGADVVADEDVPAPIHGDTGGAGEAPLRDERAGVRELLDAAVGAAL